MLPGARPFLDEVSVLAFIDQIVMPFLANLYGAVGYLGVAGCRWPSNSAMVPAAVRAHPAVRRVHGVRHQPDRADHRPAVELLDRGHRGDDRATRSGRSSPTRIGAYGGRPFLERYGKYLLIRPHEIELADSFFARHGAATVFIGRLLPIVRTFISFPAGVARMRLSTFIIYSTAGAFIWSCLLVYAGVLLGDNWLAIRHALQPFDLAIAVLVVAAVLLFVWWRLGMPGRPGRRAAEE